MEKNFDFDENSADGNKQRGEGSAPSNSKKRPMNQQSEDDKVSELFSQIES